MGVCATVRDVADAILRAKSPTNPRHILLAELLRLMSRYASAKLLAQWEGAVNDVLTSWEDSTETGKLLEATFELGFENLYGAFEPIPVREAFDRLSVLLRAANVPLTEPVLLDDW